MPSNIFFPLPGFYKYGFYLERDGGKTIIAISYYQEAVEVDSGSCFSDNSVPRDSFSNDYKF